MVDGFDVGAEFSLKMKLLEFEFVPALDVFDLAGFVRASERVEHSLYV